MKPTAIIGMGNPLMSDEGVGIHVVAGLRGTALADSVDILDLGTSSMRALHELEGRSLVVFVDCALMGTEPGTIRRFTPDDVDSKKIQPRLSLHEGDLLNTIALGRRLGTSPEQIVIFGIEPKTIEPGETLSPELAARLDQYSAAIREELGARGSADPET